MSANAPEGLPVKVNHIDYQALLDLGLIWLINTTVLHPRGYALSVRFDSLVSGQAIGLRLLGDGTEPISYAPAEDWPEGAPTPEDRFKAIKELLT